MYRHVYIFSSLKDVVYCYYVTKNKIFGAIFNFFFPPEFCQPTREKRIYEEMGETRVIARGPYIGKYRIPGGGISANVILGKNYEKEKRKRRKM